VNVSRDFILAEIRRTARDGRAMGRQSFEAETGIREHLWNRHWARWSDAVAEAGFTPNSLQGAYTDDFMLAALIEETRRLGRFPASRDLRLRHANDPSFPDSNSFQKRWRRQDQLERIAAYCADRPDYADVLAIVAPLVAQPVRAPRADATAAQALGQVYLIRSGKYHKVGHTRAFARRMRALDTALAEGRTVVHIINTDDPEGIEAYWHHRFRDRRRGDTEWFELTAEDVAAFKRRKFM
jgi:hypothetical protein